MWTRADVWQATLKKLVSPPNELGVAFAFRRQRLKEPAARRVSVGSEIYVALVTIVAGGLWGLGGIGGTGGLF